MKTIDAFINVFGGITVLEVVQVIMAIGFLLMVYRKLSKYLIDKHEEEKAKNAQLAEALTAVRKYPEYRKQSIDIQHQLEGHQAQLESQLSELKDELTELKQMMETHLKEDAVKREASVNDREALLCILRHSITEIYYRYLPTKEIPAHQYKNIILQFDAYKHEGGNTYVEAIVEDMREWKVLPE